MPKILLKEKLNEQVSKITVAAPLIARSAKAGQFVVVVPTENAERIPLTIADFDSMAGNITIIFQVIGATTRILDSLRVGDEIAHLLGPLGVPTHVENYGLVVVVGGGVGIAEIYPAVKALKAAGNRVITIIGARHKELLICQSELLVVSSKLLVATEDGSAGRHGLVTDELKELLLKERQIERVIAVGPVPMMRAVCEATRERGLTTIVSLNPLMLDATGMCGLCRVTVGGKSKLACVDGPEFDGHQVNFTELTSRLRLYQDLEKVALDHVCRLPGMN